MRCKNNRECSYGDIANTFHFIELAEVGYPGEWIYRWRVRQLRADHKISTVLICRDHHLELLLLTLFYGESSKIPYEHFGSSDIEEVKELRIKQLECK